MNKYYLLGNEGGVKSWIQIPRLAAPSSSEGPKDKPSASSPPGTQKPQLPPSLPPEVPGPPLPASQPVFPLLASDQAPGFRGEGLGCNTEPSLLLHPHPSHYAQPPPSPPPLSAIAWPQGRKKGAQEVEVRPAPRNREEPLALRRAICKASTRCPSSADHTYPEQIDPSWT